MNVLNTFKAMKRRLPDSQLQALLLEVELEIKRRYDENASGHSKGK